MKDSLQEIIKSPNDQLICFDMDGVICEGEFWGEEEPKPKTEVVEFIWNLYKRGAHIIIFTARNPRYYARTHGWLISHNVPFHGIAMVMKPGADLYIDDKALNLEDVI